VDCRNDSRVATDLPARIGLTLASKREGNLKIRLTLAQRSDFSYGARFDPVKQRLHFVPLTLLTGSDKIIFDLGSGPRPGALHVPFVLR